MHSSFGRGGRRGWARGESRRIVAVVRVYFNVSVYISICQFLFVCCDEHGAAVDRVAAGNDRLRDVGGEMRFSYGTCTKDDEMSESRGRE